MGELCKLPHHGLEQSPRSSANLSFEVMKPPFHLAVLPDDDCRANSTILERWNSGALILEQCPCSVIPLMCLKGWDDTFIYGVMFQNML